jgi:hypothetical protein
MLNTRQCNNILVNNHSRCLNKRTIECRDFNKCKKQYASYMSGSEPEYNPTNWNKPLILTSHNCYTYFLNDEVPYTKNRCMKECRRNNSCNNNRISECKQFKPQPGYYSKIKGAPFKNEYTCSNMNTNILNDNQFIKDKNEHGKNITLQDKCPKYYYKGAMVIDPGKTYHFYRQDNNIHWSHKPGTLPVSNIDASGNLIYNPQYADRDYSKNRSSNLNYTKFCKYYCIPKNSYLNTNAR